MMRHRMLGSSGLRVSELCLGTLTFGEDKAWGADEATARAILDRFAAAGGSFVDTAPNYARGRAEEIVGQHIAGDRDRWVIGTKYTASLRQNVATTGNGRKAMRLSVESSLQRLGTDYIDVLWLHYWDGTAPLDEILRGLDDLVSAGKILHVGFSDTPAWLVARGQTMADLRGVAPIAAIQLEYNLAARTAERELLPMAKALGLGVVCWGPLAAGALAGGEAPTRRPADTLPPSLKQAATRLGQVSKATEMPGIDLALAWLLHNRKWTGLIPVVGARTVEQIDRLLAAGAAATPDDATAEMLEAIAPCDLGFPHDLIGSSYLRRLAIGGDTALLVPPERNRC